MSVSDFGFLAQVKRAISSVARQSPLSTILRKLLGNLHNRYLNYLCARYDIGLKYDPPHSIADLWTRHLYARRHQGESFDLAKQIVRQYRGASTIFHIRRAIRKLKLGTIPIRVVFLASDPLDWLSLHSVYLACRADPQFKTYVVNIGFAFGPDYVTDCSELLRQQNIEYIDGTLPKEYSFAAWQNHDRFQLDLLNPDVILVGSPYDDCRPSYYGTANLLRFAKIAYICYGPDFADKAGKLANQVYGIDTQKNAWRIFSRSARTASQYWKYGRISPHRIVNLGHPRLDHFHCSSARDALPESVIAASASKFKIIYAPHHSIGGWSTFLQNADKIRRFIRDNDDCYLVFRPHPLLMQTLRQCNIMSEQEFRSYFAGDRCYQYDGDHYYGLFHWSDLLISDASSFLMEFGPTRKPIVYLHSEDGWGLDETLEEDVWKSCYVARSEDELTPLLDQLKNGLDPLKGKREPFQENMSVGMFAGGAGRRVAAYLRDTLGRRASGPRSKNLETHRHDDESRLVERHVIAA